MLSKGLYQFYQKAHSKGSARVLARDLIISPGAISFQQKAYSKGSARLPASDLIISPGAISCYQKAYSKGSARVLASDLIISPRSHFSKRLTAKEVRASSRAIAPLPPEPNDRARLNSPQIMTIALWLHRSPDNDDRAMASQVPR